MRIGSLIVAGALAPAAAADLIDIVEFSNYMMVGDVVSTTEASDVTHQEWTLSSQSAYTAQWVNVVENQLYADAQYLVVAGGEQVYSGLCFDFELLRDAEYRFNGILYANAPGGESRIWLEDASRDRVHFERTVSGHRRFDYEGLLPAGRYRFAIQVEGNTDGDAQAWFTVPEPGTLGLVVVGGVLAAGRRGRV